MLNYQKFVNAFAFLRENLEKNGIKGIEIHRKVSREKFYKIVGIEDEEKKEQYEIRKTIEMNRTIERGMDLVNQYGAIYEIDEEVKRYIMLNNPPKNKDLLKKLILPYPCIFIDTEITNLDVELGVNNITGILLMRVPKIVEDTKEKIGDIFRVYYLCQDYVEGGWSVYIDEFLIDFDDLDIFYDDKITMNFLRRFIANVLLFYNDREVQWVLHKRDAKNRERREKEGKMPLPDSHKVRLTGILKKYIDGVVSNGGFGGWYHNKFYVGGHYRFLASDKYTNMKGTWIKIEPYIKGQGIMIERNYELKFTKDDERKKEMDAQNTFFDDIKPLDKPLREIRNDKFMEKINKDAEKKAGEDNNESG